MELFKILGRIAIDGADEAKRDINNVTKEASEAGSKLASNLGKMTIKAAKIGVAAISAVSTGMGILLKNSVANYAEYEQLVGGVETLFKNSSNKVIAYAKKAYMTAGLSANAYMETVTGFTASLLQSLEGDTEKAAEMADMAITDMSDNANKMGTSMEAIQNAYSGFAKQNYTMLDNLKLGYGGTKEEMERLLEDAQELKAAQGELVEYSIDSYADIVDAIHVVQTEMGITGTTAKEASTTIQGSFGMMKAAWTNFLTGMADDKQDFSKLLDDLLDSIVTFGNNIGPRLVETLPRLVKGLGELAKKLIPYIPKAMKFLLPGLVNGARMILKEVVDNLPSILEALLGSTGRKIGEVISKALGKIVPAIVEFAEDILPILVSALEFLADNFEEIITVVGLAVAAFETMSIINTVTTAVNGASSAFGAFSAILKANPIGMVVTALGGLAVGLSSLTSLFGDNTVVVSENLRVLREETEQASENLKNYREMKSAINEKIAAQLSEVNNTERLWKELLTLRDAQGNVNEADKERAQFIINELNSAIGTEIEIVGNHIDITEEDIDTINRLIEAKKAEIYLKANEEAYAEAIQNIRQAQIDATEKYIQMEELRNKKMDEVSKLRLLKAKAETEGLTEELDTQIRQQEAYTNEVIAQYDEAYAAYEKNKNFMIACQQDIDAYESASIEIQKGNYDKAIQMLDNKGQAYLRAADLGRQATEEEKQQFLEQAQATTDYYRFIRENYEKGMEGFTQEMVANAEKNMEIAWQEYASVGGAMVDGITAGANSQSSIINDAIMNIVRNAMVAGQSAATGSSYTAPSSAARAKTNKENNYGSRYTKTARGGVVEKGKTAFLEGHGTEAIVPLEYNRAWISKVAADMDNALGGTSNPEMLNLMASMNNLINNLPDMMADAMCSVKVGLDKREVGRMVRQVNV